MRSTKSIIAILAAIILVDTGCQKSNNTPKDETQLQASVTQNAADEYNIQTSEQSMSEDANTAVAADPSFSVVSENLLDSSTIEGAIIDRSLISPLDKRIKITYMDMTVLGVKRSGTITVELVNGDSWLNAGAVLKITVDAFKVTFLGKSWLYNGTCYLTNVSGGLAFITPDI